MLRSILLASALVTATVTTSISQEPIIQYDRTAKVFERDGGKMVHDFGAHPRNPWPGKAACEAGVEEDTQTLTIMLMMHGIDPTPFEVRVVCTVRGNPA